MPTRPTRLAPERLERWSAEQGSDAGHRKIPRIVDDRESLSGLLGDDAPR